MIQDFEEKESLLLRKIAGLELAKERIEEGAVSDLEQLRIEVTCSFVLSFGWSLQKGFLMLYQSWALQTINCIRHDMVKDLGLSWFTLFIFRLSDNTHVDFVCKTCSISNWFVYTFYGHYLCENMWWGGWNVFLSGSLCSFKSKMRSSGSREVNFDQKGTRTGCSKVKQSICERSWLYPFGPLRWQCHEALRWTWNKWSAFELLLHGKIQEVMMHGLIIECV